VEDRGRVGRVADDDEVGVRGDGPRVEGEAVLGAEDNAVDEVAGGAEG
jgi:hypothetical protein